MGREIPVQLQDALSRDTSTTCLLMRVDPVDPRFISYGVTSLDRPIDYDDGDGALKYSAAIGFTATASQTSATLTVDNAEATSLMPEFDIPVSEADIRAGAYDFARFRLMLVDYENLAAGHITLSEGTLGRITVDDDGLSFTDELRGLSAELKQSICEKDSLTCRATYGSQPAGSATPGPVERFPCGKDATAELVSGTVTVVDTESTLTFTVGGFAMAADALNPGMVFWLTGANAGRSNEVESNTSGGVITLAHETSFPIQVGDTLQYRPDCNKQARDTAKGCKAAHHWGTSWPLHFRGEPDIPIGDAGAMETPGASSAPGSGGNTNQPFAAEAE